MEDKYGQPYVRSPSMVGERMVDALWRTMFLLRQLTVLGVSRISCSDPFRKCTKLRNYVRSTLSNSSRALVPEKDIPKCCYKKVICCNYSSEARDKAEVLDPVNDDGEVGELTTEELFEEIADGDPQVLRKLKLIQFEVEVLRETEKYVPTVIKKKEWEYILTLNSITARKKYLHFLFKNEKKVENKKEKKRIKKELYLQTKKELDSNSMDYSLSSQSIFMRIYKKNLNQALSLRISEDTAQHVVFDCSYQEYMNSFNSRLCAVQLQYSLNLNLFHHYPCFVRLCNLKQEDYLYKILPNYMVNMFEEDFPWEIHENSYLDLYPKKQLVYLTPHCNEPLQQLNPGDVYVIGAFVDKGCGVKASLARAKKHNLRMAKFPLDEYIRWKQGTKSLPLNIVLKILLDMKISRNWNIALQNVPRRHYSGLDYDFDINTTHDLLV